MGIQFCLARSQDCTSKMKYYSFLGRVQLCLTSTWPPIRSTKRSSKLATELRARAPGLFSNDPSVWLRLVSIRSVPGEDGCNASTCEDLCAQISMRLRREKDQVQKNARWLRGEDRESVGLSVLPVGTTVANIEQVHFVRSEIRRKFLSCDRVITG